MQKYKTSNLHLAREYARIFVLGHYLLLEAQNFSSCYALGKPFLGTDNVRECIRAKWRLLFI